MSSSQRDRLERIGGALRQHGQAHLLAHWDGLNDERREALLADVEQINLASLDALIESQVRGTVRFARPADIHPVRFYPAQPGIDQVGKYADAVKRGGSLIRRNKVAAFTVAGGQGTRLGFDGPKGV